MQIDRTHLKDHFVKAVMEPCVHPQVNQLFFQLLSDTRPDRRDENNPLKIQSELNERIFVLIDKFEEEKVKEVSDKIKALAERPLTQSYGSEGKQIALTLIASETLQAITEQYVKDIYSQSAKYLTPKILENLKSNIDKSLKV